MGMEKIRHLVVLMLENRSFDNMVGYVYAAENNRPPINIPAPPPGSPTTYEGLPNALEGTDFWNPSNADFFTENAPAQQVFVNSRITDFTTPNPDPEERFDHMTYQLFGPYPPASFDPKQMKGFYLDYANKSKAPADIMKCYSADQVPVIAALARNYAVCDRWFASSPTQTWPNRAFVHLGTSLGKVNNWPNDPFHYNIQTIFNVLDGLKTPWGEPATWGVFTDSQLIWFTRLQLPKLWNPALNSHFQGFDAFRRRALEGSLPTYSFVEPEFMHNPNDEHPPHDVRRGEQFIYDVWNAVSTGKAWDETVLIVTYDEHGGCYDHATPPFGATPPDDASRHGELGFGFDRFGVRVPVVIVSPYIEAGTVFRSTTATPYDHTSILATLREWLQIPATAMLPSARIKVAPTFSGILTRNNPRGELPKITPRPDTLAAVAVATSEPPNDMQKGIMLAVESKQLGRSLTIPEIHDLLSKFPTREHLADFFRHKM
ncbi:MAG TPA: alkaline phosphatase family protein [Candidatus Binataceae bacterium]|nr:alkaline phosphatase family protein [Candidatus Binataceae bacterium]